MALVGMPVVVIAVEVVAELGRPGADGLDGIGEFGIFLLAAAFGLAEGEGGESYQKKHQSHGGIIGHRAAGRL